MDVAFNFARQSAYSLSSRTSCISIQPSTTVLLAPRVIRTVKYSSMSLKLLCETIVHIGQAFWQWQNHDKNFNAVDLGMLQRLGITNYWYRSFKVGPKDTRTSESSCKIKYEVLRKINHPMGKIIIFTNGVVRHIIFDNCELGCGIQKDKQWSQ